MSASQYFPIPPGMLALASETVSRRVSRLPFLRSGVNVTGELMGVAMECLNAEFSKSLPFTTPRDAPAGSMEGLDRQLEERMRVSGKTVVPVIAEVLIAAGIAEPAEILDRLLHRPRKGIRLCKPWTWDGCPGSGPGVNLPAGGEEREPLSWMSLCPVCKTGILNKVMGKQLFGIPRTDFIIECTHCGAKFIPVGAQYRLVSIATIRDPLWKKHLDKTYHPDTWAGLARGNMPGGKTAVVRAAPKIPALPGRGPGTGPVQLKKSGDGSLAVPVGQGTLFFRPVLLKFSGGARDDAFARSQKLLADVLAVPAFSHLRERVLAGYSRYLPLPLGLFLSQLKERHDPFYREFLNPFGDDRYCSFRMAAPAGADRNGVIIVAVGTGPYQVISSPDPFGSVINNRLGRVTPDDCLLNGDSVKCRVNALLCSCRNEAMLYQYAAGGEDERARIAGALEDLISPDRK